MTHRPLLSICIPTYNREGFLRECLSSLDLTDLGSAVEIIVSDNASTDATLKVLEAFKATLPLRYIVQSENLGPDRNFDAVITAANGEYCWLLGSDDAVVPHGVSKLVALLSSHPADIIQFGYVQADLHMRPLHRAAPQAGQVDTKPRALAAHLAAQQNMSLLFTFISAYAFKRSIWMVRQELIRTWVGSFYIQTYAMHSALVAGASLLAIEECLVIARGGNPNELNTVPGRFMALDARTVTRLIREVYSCSNEFWKAFGTPFRRSYPAKVLINIAANDGLIYIKENREALLRMGHSKTLINGLFLLKNLKLLPAVKWMINLLRPALKKIHSQEIPS